MIFSDTHRHGNANKQPPRTAIVLFTPSAAHHTTARTLGHRNMRGTRYAGRKYLRIVRLTGNPALRTCVCSSVIPGSPAMYLFGCLERLPVCASAALSACWLSVGLGWARFCCPWRRLFVLVPRAVGQARFIFTMDGRGAKGSTYAYVGCPTSQQRYFSFHVCSTASMWAFSVHDTLYSSPGTRLYSDHLSVCVRGLHVERGAVRR